MTLRSETVKLSRAVRDKIEGPWLRAHLFFGLADGATSQMLYIDRNADEPIEEVFPARDISDVLFKLYDRSVQSGNPIQSGALTINPAGAFELEVGYEDILVAEDRSIEFLQEMRRKYFADRAVIPATLDDD